MTVAIIKHQFFALLEADADSDQIKKVERGDNVDPRPFVEECADFFADRRARAIVLLRNGLVDWNVKSCAGLLTLCGREDIYQVISVPVPILRRHIPMYEG